MTAAKPRPDPPMTFEEWVRDAVARTPAPTPEQLSLVRRHLAPTQTSRTRGKQRSTA